uniref:SH3 and cysteine rich domain n=1 Tax=Podarcis muralis TaxID=64176 RepID=A0A670JZH0_PODMU
PRGGVRSPSFGPSLQKLKRSLSFKTKSLRSKSADNFFQRTNSDMKLQVDLLSEISPRTGQLSASESQTSTPTIVQHQQESNKTHIFQEHIFKKPTFCDICNHMIVGTNAKHGLRCKACKLSIHHRCAESIGQQRCMGKLPKGFRRYYSSPLLIHEQFGCIKEVMPIACGNKVDPVYETLRFGTSLAQKMKKGSSGSSSDSPKRNSVSVLFWVVAKFFHSISTYFPQKGLGCLVTCHFLLLFTKPLLQAPDFFGNDIYCFTACTLICITSEKEHDGFIKVCSGKKKGFVPVDALENI